MRKATGAALLALCLTLPALPGCAGDTPDASRSPALPGHGAYVVDTDPGDAPCSRVVSALGFADLLLLPPGEEERQSFDEAVRGRLAYVESVVLQYGSRLPVEVHPQEATLRRAARALAPAAGSHEEQVRMLETYREAEKAVLAACP